MKYKLQQETKPKLSTFGKYKAVAVHQQTVGTKDIAKVLAVLGIMRIFVASKSMIMRKGLLFCLVGGLFSVLGCAMKKMPEGELVRVEFSRHGTMARAEFEGCVEQDSTGAFVLRAMKETYGPLFEKRLDAETMKMPGLGVMDSNGSAAICRNWFHIYSFIAMLCDFLGVRYV